MIYDRLNEKQKRIYYGQIICSSLLDVLCRLETAEVDFCEDWQSLGGFDLRVVGGDCDFITSVWCCFI